jgi:hypothetical protein
MNDETLNNEIRRFLKKVGIQSHQAIERAIQAGVATGQLQGTEHLNAVMQLHVEGLNLDLQIKGDIALQ